jgi:predicted nucleic acid-binding Zn ribbon protein
MSGDYDRKLINIITEAESESWVWSAASRSASARVMYSTKPLKVARSCVVCGKKFIGRRDALYCSANCRQKAFITAKKAKKTAEITAKITQKTK